MTIDNLSDTIKPNSTQLNADDLLTGPMRVRITDVSRGSADQPISIGIEQVGGGSGKLMPYKPCKSMRRVLIAAWGKDGQTWVDREMVLYCDPTVKWGGQEVGGIRISDMSDIDRDQEFSLTVTRGKRANHKVRKLETAQYPQAEFDKNFPAMKAAIESGRSTVEKIIAHCEKTGKLSQDMKMQLAEVVPPKTEE